MLGEYFWGVQTTYWLGCAAKCICVKWFWMNVCNINQTSRLKCQNSSSSWFTMIIAIYSCNSLTNRFHVQDKGRKGTSQTLIRHCWDAFPTWFASKFVKLSGSRHEMQSRLSQAYCASLSLPETSLGSPTEAEASDTHKDRKIPWYVTLQWKSQWHKWLLISPSQPCLTLRGTCEGPKALHPQEMDLLLAQQRDLWTCVVQDDGDHWVSIYIYLYNIYIYIHMHLKSFIYISMHLHKCV